MNNETNSSATQEQQAQINQIIINYMKERKTSRRWKIFTRTIIGLFILFILGNLMLESMKLKKEEASPHVGLIDLNGNIADGESGGADNFAKGMEQAYKKKGLKAMVIRINSPGGSPVQAEYMYNTIRYYQSKYPEKKIYAVCVDLCASAAYYVAAAADEIYASPGSLVGSIGVLYNGFGFVDAMQKLGITRRLFTSGENKGFLDPFSPTTPTQQAYLQTMLNLIHEQFIDRVKTGRGTRLHADKDTFSGLFWTGQQAMGIGLIDGFASAGQLVREKLKLDKVIDYTYEQSVFEKFAKNMGASLASNLPSALGMKQGLQ